MTEKQKIDFLLKLVKTQKFELTVEEAHAFFSAYAALVKIYKEMKEEE